MNIDYVTSFVNGDDKEWGMDFLRFFDGKISWANSATRFRDWDTLRYSLRGICKHMPWTNRIFLILSDSQGQIPQWLCTDNPRLHIVRHSEFIPHEVLPTFNSNVIDLFIPRIKELGQRFIYGCDDYVVVKDVKEEDFFTGNGISVKLEMRYFPHCLYTSSILNSNELIDKWLVYKSDSGYIMPYCDHALVPHLKSYDLELLNAHALDLPRFCSRFRSRDDVTWQIFLLYLYKRGLLTSKGVKTKYCGLYNSNDITSLTFQDSDVIVLNDEYHDSFREGRILLNSRLDEILPENCEFEK